MHSWTNSRSSSVKNNIKMEYQRLQEQIFMRQRNNAHKLRVLTTIMEKLASLKHVHLGG